MASSQEQTPAQKCLKKRAQGASIVKIFWSRSKTPANNPEEKKTGRVTWDRQEEGCMHMNTSPARRGESFHRQPRMMADRVESNIAIPAGFSHLKHTHSYLAPVYWYTPKHHGGAPTSENATHNYRYLRYESLPQRRQHLFIRSRQNGHRNYHR